MTWRMGRKRRRVGKMSDEKATRKYDLSHRPRRDHLREAAGRLRDHCRAGFDLAATKTDITKAEKARERMSKVAAWLEEKADE